MKPDKIYIQPNAHDRWFEGNKPNDNFVEYIRKDALIEWAKGEIMPGNSAEGKGWNRALQTLIDKINSM